MRAMWADGPHKGESVYLRGAHVVVDRGIGARPGDPPVAEREVWDVREIAVGDRRWRVIIPPDWTLDKALLALIDATPDQVRACEVNPL